MVRPFVFPPLYAPHTSRTMARLPPPSHLPTHAPPQEDHPDPFFTPVLEPVQVAQKIVDAYESGLSQHIIAPMLMNMLPWLRVMPDWMKRIIAIVSVMSLAELPSEERQSRFAQVRVCFAPATRALPSRSLGRQNRFPDQRQVHFSLTQQRLHVQIRTCPARYSSFHTTHTLSPSLLSLLEPILTLISALHTAHAPFRNHRKEKTKSSSSAQRQTCSKRSSTVARLHR